MGFLLVMELTSSSHTSFAAGLVLISYTVGEVIFIGFAYFTRHWLNLKWLTTAYFDVTIPYLYFVPESPYWLESRQKYTELEKSLRKIAKINKRSDADWLPQFQQYVQERQQSKEMLENEKRAKRSKLIRFIPRLCLCGLIEFVTMLLYTKIAYDLGEDNETISPYWSFVIGAALEAVGYVMASFLISTRWGRKRSLISFALVTAASVLVVPFIMDSYPLISTIVSQIGKLAISGAVCVSWVYVPELFPTFMRGLANAVFVFVGSFGSMIAPIADSAVSEKHEKITFYVYAGLTVLLAGIISTLPETRDRSFDDGGEHHDVTQTDAIQERNDAAQPETEDAMETKL